MGKDGRVKEWLLLLTQILLLYVGEDDDDDVVGYQNANCIPSIPSLLSLQSCCPCERFTLRCRAVAAATTEFAPPQVHSNVSSEIHMSSMRHPCSKAN